MCSKLNMIMLSCSFVVYSLLCTSMKFPLQSELYKLCFIFQLLLRREELLDRIRGNNGKKLVQIT